jgi:hypothetical protein
MDYVQVKSFNTSKGGTTPNMCLANVTAGYGVPNLYGSAWEAWEHTQQHADRNVPTGVDVPLYYSYTATIDGSTQNYGHINVRLANGTVWSDGNIYASIDAYLAGHTPKFVGWGESVNNVAVIAGSEEEMFNEGDAVNFNNYFFGKDNGLFRDQVGQVWKTASYNIMEYMNTNKNLLFNEGDRVNLNNALYGKDMTRFKAGVGGSWKQAISDVMQDKDFQTDALVNTGDVPAINKLTGRTDANTQVGKTWKDLFEYYLVPNFTADTTYVPYAGQLYTKKS